MRKPLWFISVCFGPRIIYGFFFASAFYLKIIFVVWCLEYFCQSICQDCYTNKKQFIGGIRRNLILMRISYSRCMFSDSSQKLDPIRQHLYYYYFFIIWIINDKGQWNELKRTLEINVDQSLFIPLVYRFFVLMIVMKFFFNKMERQ